VTAKPRRAVYAISRRQRFAVTILCLMAALFAVCFDYSCHSHRQQGTSSQQRAAVSDYERYNDKTFRVVKVVDGDTIDIDIPDGKYDHTRIRLLGIDTPETKNPKIGVMYFGPQASEFTSKLTLERQVRVFLDVKSRDKYNRLLAYIQLPDGKFLNEELLSEGFAYADVRFKHSYYHKYMQLESVAKRAKKGLWEGITYDQLPQWRQKREPNLLRK
jgi:endonuclease YncB( thermonuclease family)